MVLGCKECAYENSKGGPARLTLEQFLERSKVIHNNFYSYDKIDFTNKTAKQKVTITCPCMVILNKKSIVILKE